ncbi:SigE family RNA polymerase sigma factor [Micromonospora auratinigra]|uniref:RNA polymerase sigma-70 factor, sigma-E family n=1 Tax=Micromonospora auratinigra TaxID=261654 RepID=A0A1A8ZSN1_9ACTN|nr:SigE family RNA polymerase sigma factor [Micromonospora auratinigra]SBT46890.1 RNA polymerase sigma-70 factor, sigma-E family [Micromonospora auratinigra]
MPDASDQEYVEYVSARLPALRRLAYALSGDADQADDLVQEAATRLYLRWSRIGEVDRLDAYVRTVLVRLFLDSRRRGWWRVHLFGGPPDVRATEDRGVEDRTVLRAALAQVPPRQRAVLVLRFLHDLPVDEVARTLGCSAGTVKSQTSHGLATMRRLLGDREFAGRAGEERGR